MKAWGLIVVAAAVLGSLQLASSPRPALAVHQCDSWPGAFPIDAYEAQASGTLSWRNVYARTMDLAGFNQLLPDVQNFNLPLLETGPRSAGSSSPINPYIPPTLLKAIGWIESSWSQACPSVPYGGVGRTLVSHDFGYGIMQITSGMGNGTTAEPNLDQVMIGGHYGFNIARGARILAEKWNYAPQYRPLVGDRNPSIVENWYYAVWSYNSFSFRNHPLNPALSLTRGVYRCDGTQPRSNYTYPELIFGCMANPPVRDGILLWEPLPVTLPNLSDPALSLDSWIACRDSFNCAAMDMPTPSPAHGDPTVSSGDRAQALGVPALSLSTTNVFLRVDEGTVGEPVSIGVSNAGTGPLVWRLSPSVPWLRLSRFQGVSRGADIGSQTVTFSLYADASALGPGTYSGNIAVESLYASGAPQNIGITLEVFPMLLKGSASTVYVKLGSLKRAVPNPATFEAEGYRWASVNVIADSVLSSIPEGDPLLNALADGNLLKGSSTTV
ncbi:MAG TPA: hypothetical protein VJA25_14625, partial [Dehalococcoidia bacterium]|nr:hypothetical protein [Dehalococcoidia bacterium]